MSFEYINETYGLNVKKGDRILFTYECPPREGAVTGTHAGKLKIRLDGDKVSSVFHPTWELKYL